MTESLYTKPENPPLMKINLFAPALSRATFVHRLCALGLAAWFLAGVPAWSAPAEARVTYAESIGEVPAAIAPTVHALAAPEMAGSIDFSIALRMRDFARLQERVARGETISSEEMAKTYLPLPKDYETTENWLRSEGFFIVAEDSSRLSIFARGTLTQVEKSLQTKIVGVTVKGVKYPAATTAPSLPASVAAPVLGINGLQPYHRPHKHATIRPAASTTGVTYKVNDILTAYDAKNLGVTGRNQTIAILIDTTPSPADLASFWSANSVAQSAANVTTINVNDATLPAVSGEETLDVEWSSGIAPDAKIRVYATGDLSDTSLDKGLARIIADVGNDATIRQLTISLGEGETYESASQFTTDAQYFATLASQGVSTFVSSGDGGSTPDDTGSGNEDAGPLQVEYFSSDPNVTGVGGTTLHLTTSNTRSSETAWSGSGGGASIHFAKPAWQVGPGVPSGTKRFVPDVALPADPYTGAYVYLQGSPQTIGGTSWASPTWAGFCALLNEARANAGKTGGIGLLNPSLYPLLGTANFYDVTGGSNAEGAKAAGKYPATAGYDPVTGLGTPDVAVLIKTLAGQPTAPTPTPAPNGPTLTGFSPANGPAGTAVTINGANFGGVAVVSFNGASANYALNSPAQIIATVPTGATTGPIKVVTTAGSVAGASPFTVTADQGGTGSSLVISQVYGGGGGGTAVYANDYIELFNPTAAPVDLGVYSVQYTSAAGKAWNVTKLAGSLASGHYFLVSEKGGGAGKALPVADASGSISLSTTAGKVALVSSQTAIASYTSPDVVDFVGYGASANEYEGAGPAPTLSAKAADLRGSNGRADTHNNAADFAAGPPTPRNSQSAPAILEPLP